MSHIEERHSMLFSIFLILLGLFSAGLLLLAVAFYAGWEAKCQMEREFDGLLRRLTGA